MLPQLNMFANNLTLWDLTVEDIQVGGGYPGSEGCNNLIPHAKVRMENISTLEIVVMMINN